MELHSLSPSRSCPYVWQSRVAPAQRGSQRMFSIWSPPKSLGCQSWKCRFHLSRQRQLQPGKMLLLVSIGHLSPCSHQLTHKSPISPIMRMPSAQASLRCLSPSTTLPLDSSCNFPSNKTEWRPPAKPTTRRVRLSIGLGVWEIGGHRLGLTPWA